MYTYEYPRPALTVDIVLMDTDRSQVLLIQRGNDPFKDCWAFPGGFFDMDDCDIDHAAHRELEEETGLSNIVLHQALVASRMGRDPRERTVSVVFAGVVDPASVSPCAADDAKLARWFALNALPPLAFDHEEILSKLCRGEIMFLN